MTLTFKIFTDNKEEFSDLVVSNGLYILTTKYIYKITINGVEYEFYNYENDINIKPYLKAKKLGIPDLLNYLEKNAVKYEIKDYLILNNDFQDNMIYPIENPSNYIWCFLLDNDKIVASITTDYIVEYNGIKMLYIGYINSFQKGNCKIICNEFMNFLRLWNVDIMYLNSVGGVAGVKCYINSFLINDNGYKYLDVENEITLDKNDAKTWLFDTCDIKHKCDNSYIMIFYDDKNLLTDNVKSYIINS